MITLKPTPGRNNFVHRFPLDVPPGEVISVTIGGLKKGLLDSNSLIVRPFKLPKQQRQERSTLVEMEFGQKIRDC